MEVPEAHISTSVRPADDPNMVAKAILQLFPNITLPIIEEKQFPIRNNIIEWEFHDIDLATFLNRIAELRILDTSLDAMAANIHNNETIFSISRQAAIANKISYVLPNEKSLGGTIEIHLKGTDLESWLEEATWHEGRLEVPRFVSDEFAMRRDGKVTEWFEKNK
ncbi:MAG: hypothetical protein CMO20_05910 [Thermoplasmata archaeon]|nr:hypothetical protein [Thermoplasmata archaeon]|tara:strand:- start:297 stop:791 length:495 start_codon:yes stop_codon:yes gene_type:complete